MSLTVGLRGLGIRGSRLMPDVLSNFVSHATYAKQPNATNNQPDKFVRKLAMTKSFRNSFRI